MKLRLFIFASFALLLAACNMTLAADITPPPNYVPPAPAPTLGPLFPAQPMDVANGQSIYAEKCAACHGETGLGDGEQGKQLPVKVAPLGLPETAAKAQPAAWYAQVTRGNLERFMPPFASLNDQERWDVVGYALTLHVTPEKVAQGKQLAEENCPQCAAYFSNLKSMSALSEADLMAIVQNGRDEIPAFGKNLSAEELTAVAMYLRSLTFAAPLTQVEPTLAPEATAPAEPAAESTPADGTPAATPEATATAEAAQLGLGKIFGALDNPAGIEIPADSKVILHGYEHNGDTNSAPQEVLTLEGVLSADGSYLFEGVEMPESRIFIAELNFGGVSYQSSFAVVEAGAAELEMPAITVYESTADVSVLKITALQIFFDYSDPNAVQMFSLYSIMNDSGKMVTVPMSAEQQQIPFLATAQGATLTGYEAGQDSAPFLGTGDGFAMPPSETPYSLIAFSTLTAAKEVEVAQLVLLPVAEVSLFLPEGVTAKGENLKDEGAQPMDAMQGVNFHVYSAPALEKGETLSFTISGAPKEADAADAEPAQNQNLLIGVGAFGVVLIALGGWLFLRDRNKGEEEEDEENEEDEEDEQDAEDVMDAIIALDDLRRAGKISDEAYHKRRDELKSKLKKG